MTENIMTETTMLGKDDLKDCTISELLEIPLANIEDMTEFLLPPKGVYKLRVDQCEVRMPGDFEVIALDLTILETIELSNVNTTKAKDGSKFGMQYLPGFGVQQFKTIFAPVAASLGASHLGELISNLNGAEIIVTVDHRAKKDRNEKKEVIDTTYFPNLKNPVLA